MDIGVISDTHGRIHPGALKVLRGVRRILHAGDIGGLHVLQSLKHVAPVAAVLGNVDDPSLHPILPWHRIEEVAGVRILVVHVLGKPARPDPGPAALIRAHAPRVVIFGHSHRPLCEERDGILFLNPGSAGSPRFGLVPSVARLRLGKGPPEAVILPLIPPE